MNNNLTDQELVRRQKMNELKSKGIDPFGGAFKRTTNSEELKIKFANHTKEELEELNFRAIVAGRIMTKRGKGKAGFMHLQDRHGQIQIYCRSDHLSELEYEIFRKSDLGDIVGAEGVVIRTNTGEITVKATKLTHLAKALRPLPEKYHGLQDVEEARRRRYLDLIVNENSRKVAFLRPKIIRAFQKFFDGKGFVEVETPILHTILGGANARPFVTHHNALHMDFYLRIATELHLKRLIVGGMEAVYEIGRLFRNEGMDSTHNPEFTSVEAYLAYSDMEGMMNLVEECFRFVSNEVLGVCAVEYQGQTIDFAKDFKRVHMVDAIKEVTGIDFFAVKSDEEAVALAREHNIELKKHEKSYGHVVNLFFETYAEERIIQPTFVYGHPIEISPLAKKAKDPRFTERFELFINKKEYANAFSELNDPIDQRERFEKQLKEKDLGNEEANEMDIDYIEALEYGMPPTGGVGIGIDRTAMLLANVDSIRDIILFPHMRIKK
ncbi:MAG: lysine--tRNA ligase [Acholeplasmataceae bacterium]|nr:lysine--tRNA ligase [Acholeplasmataceae bacterium]